MDNDVTAHNISPTRLESLRHEGLSGKEADELHGKLCRFDSAQEPPVRLRNQLLLIPEEENSVVFFFKRSWGIGLVATCALFALVFTYQNLPTQSSRLRSTTLTEAASDELSYLVESPIFEFDLFDSDVALLENI